MKHQLVLAVAPLAAMVPALAHSQTVNQYNYKQYAVCAENVISGRTFNTITGEGPCPPGSKRLPSPTRTIDPNAQTLARTQAAVNAIGGMQQAVLAWGQARVQKMRVESARIMSTYAMDLSAAAPSEGQGKYTETLRLFPQAGGFATAAQGEALVASQAGFYADCFVAQANYEKTYMGWVHVIKAGQPACKLAKDDKGFTPSYTNYSRDKDRESDPFVYEQFVDLKEQFYAICIKDMGIKFGCSKEIPADAVQMVPGFVGKRGSERPVVTYLGVRDGLLVFGYVAPAAPAGSPLVEVTVNPAESRTVTIGSIHFEVMEWSDSAIAVKMQ